MKFLNPLPFIRWFLGKLILFGNSMFPPKKIERSAQELEKLARLSSSMTLYQFEACPFCVKVRRAMKRLGVHPEIRDALPGTPGASELLKGGGQMQVPCLKISEEGGRTQWMYESSDIIDYLERVASF